METNEAGSSPSTNGSRKRKNLDIFESESAKKVNGGQEVGGTSIQPQQNNQPNGYTSTPAVALRNTQRTSPIDVPNLSLSPVSNDFPLIDMFPLSPALSAPETPPSTVSVSALRQHIERCTQYALALRSDTVTGNPSIQAVKDKAMKVFGQSKGHAFLKFIYSEIKKYVRLHEGWLTAPFRKSMDNVYLRTLERLTEDLATHGSGNSSKRRLSLDSSLHPLVQSNLAIRDDEIVKPMGKTTTGPLYIVINKRKNQVSCWKASGPGDRTRQSFRNVVLNECQALSLLRHDNVVKYYTSWVECDSLYLSMEFCFGASLFHFLYPSRCPLNLTKTHDTGDCLENTGRCLQEKGLVCLLKQMASALNYLHNTIGICHNDIKPSNILISLVPAKLAQIVYTYPKLTQMRRQINKALSIDRLNGIIFKLGDFGLANSIEDVESDWDMGDGRYMPSLESLDTSEYFAQGVDIYSLGVTMYHAAGGYMEEELLRSFRFEGMPSKALAVLPTKLRAIVSKMTSVKPEDRYRTEDLNATAEAL